MIADDPDTACGYVSSVMTSNVDPDLLTAATESVNDKGDQTEIANILRGLTKNGPIAFDDARKHLREAGYEVSDKTIQRARKRAGLEPIPPERFGGKRSFGRLEHLEQNGHERLDTPPSSELSTLCPHTINWEYIPFCISPDSSEEDRVIVAGLDDDQ